MTRLVALLVALKKVPKATYDKVKAAAAGL
jgi:hypothetical protein